METLPGIAQVLRSPVADAFVKLIRQGSRHPEFQMADAEEILRYSVRRNLLSQDESDRVMAEVREGMQKRADRAADRAEARKPAPAAKAAKPPAKAKAPPKAKAPAKAPVKAKPAAKAKPAKKAKAAKPVKKAKAAKPAPKKKAPARKR